MDNFSQRDGFLALLHLSPSPWVQESSVLLECHLQLAAIHWSLCNPVQVVSAGGLGDWTVWHLSEIQLHPPVLDFVMLQVAESLIQEHLSPLMVLQVWEDDS
jgi:hypothetical protein